MSAYMIFFIFLTAALVLYYATVITMDWNAKPKKEGKHEEIITVNMESGAEEEIVPQIVVESADAGGFSFVRETPDEGSKETSDSPTEDIEEDTEAISETPSQVAYQPDNTDTDTVTDTDKNAEPEPAEAAAGPAEASEQPHEEVTEAAVEEPSEGAVVSAVIPEDSKAKQANDEPFDESQVFDHSLMQPRYEVRTIIGNSKDAELDRRIDDLNRRLLECTTSGGLIDPAKFTRELRENHENSDIDIRNEYIRF